MARAETVSRLRPVSAKTVQPAGRRARAIRFVLVWSIIVPVKRLAEAKSRLAPWPDEHRRALALAFATDCVAAASRSPLVSAVYVVTADPAAATRLGGLGARIVPDDGAGGLNGALESGVLRALADRPGSRVAALTADLPSLRTAQLTEALAISGSRRSFVPDLAGRGSTMLAAAESEALAPRFGPDSRVRHEASGARALLEAGHTLRQDVDTPADLAAALRLGVGPYTAAVTNAYPGLMQGTVRTFDPATRGGTVLLDDGTELPYAAAAFDAGGLRLARVGQRVALRADDTGRITVLTLVTMPLPG
jgi:2-phospho-L-lactate guanylyltransferase